MKFSALLLGVFVVLTNPFDNIFSLVGGSSNGLPIAGVINVAAQGYQLGLGIADVTGPIVEVNMMGYASSSQIGTGLYMRLRSRAFIVADANGANRWVLINSDICMGDTAVRRGIVEKLSALYPGVYSDQNVALVGTHSHSGVAGYLQNVLPQITSAGFSKQNYDAIVDGTVLAVQRAHTSLAPGNLSVGNKTVLNANVNRSPYAYTFNPAEERAKYQYDVDKELHLLRFDDASGNARGFASWFAVHGTSVFINNTIINADNKGMAANIYETSMNPNATPGNNTFVAGFFQANVGDTTPNTLGAYCETGADNNKKCTYENSTCNGVATGCQGRGPAFPGSDYASSTIIGQSQASGAKDLMGSKLASLSGTVKSLHTTVDMGAYTFKLANGTTVTTCPPALGYGFAGGTTDGAGYFDFTQDNNSTTQNPFWEVVKGAIGGYPTAAQKACQAPKPILLNTGYANWPYQWSPHVVDIQMFRAGQLVVIVVPAEFTTMSGRRMRDTIRAQLIAKNVIGNDAYVVLTGPANTYSHYVATPEEYGVQRYEGASTIYGPWTLPAYIDIYSNLVGFLADSNTTAVAPGPGTPDNRGNAFSFISGVVYDNPPIGKSYGSVLTDVAASYTAGKTVTAVFQGANPRNDLKLESSYLWVQKQSGSTWTTVKTDSNPSTLFKWARQDGLLGTSNVTLSWTIEPGTPAGSYRILYTGNAKAPVTGKISPISGTSATFTVS